MGKGMCTKINEWRLGLHPSTKNKPSCKVAWCAKPWWMRDTARPVFVHAGCILKRKDMPHSPNYLIKGEEEQGQMVHRLSCLGGITITVQNRGELENKTVLGCYSGGQTLALMSEHWGIHKLSLNLSEKKHYGHLYAMSTPALMLLLRLFRLDGTGTFTEMDVWRKQNMPGLTMMTFFSLSNSAAGVHLKSGDWNASKLQANKLSLPLDLLG